MFTLLLIGLQTAFLLLEHNVLDSFDDLQEVIESFKASSSFYDFKKLKDEKDNMEKDAFFSCGFFISFNFLFFSWRY